MKPFDVLKLTLGSVLVYGLSAACSGADTPQSFAGSGGGGASPDTSTGSAGSSPEVRDGSRLRARYFVGADGSRAPTGAWFDSQLGAECAFGVALYELLCVPTDVAGGTLQFADAGCTKPLVTPSSPPFTCDASGAPHGAAAFFLVGGSGAPACEPSRLFRAGAAVAPTRVWQLASTGQCVTDSVGANGYYVAEEIRASDLVAATID